MKRRIFLSTLASVAALTLATGCMSSKWTRLIPENKSSDIYVRSIYGTIEIHTRVPGDFATNAPLIIDGGSIPPGSVLQLRAR